MLAKKFKLPIQLFPGKRGKLVKSSYFTLKVFPAAFEFSRFGVTVSSKVAPKASARNKIRRSAFNFFRDSGRSFPVADYWITVLPPSASLPRKEFVSKLGALLDTKY